MTLREQIIEVVNSAVLQFEWGCEASTVADAVLAAIAAAAREGGDAKQAPGSAPQSGGTAASPDPRRIA